MKNLMLLLCMTALMVGCASNGGKSNRAKNIQVSHNAKVVLADKDSEEKVICRQTKRMGSNRITTVCLSQSERQSIQEATQRELNRGAQSGPKSGESKGF